MDNKTKKNIKNILLDIALLPYIIIMIMCIYYAIIGYVYGSALGATVYGIEAMKCFIGDIYKAIWMSPNSIILLPVIILWIGYQIYYLITFKKSKNKSENENENENENKMENRNTVKSVNLSKILFYIAIARWCLYFIEGIFIFFSRVMNGERNTTATCIYI